MSERTIVKFGHQAFQMPASMLYWLTTGLLGGRALRVLHWILWDAHARDLWPGLEDEPTDRIVRIVGMDLRAGAGLDGDNGYAGLRAALTEFAGVGFIDDGTGSDAVRFLPMLLEERPGPHFDILLPRRLAEENRRPLGLFALLNMDDVRGLRQPLDFALYARACQVARQRRPQFEITLDEIARITGSPQVGWSALSGTFSGACVRVARRTGARLLVQGWCGGDHAGIDRLLVRVGMPGQPMDRRFRPQLAQRLFEVDKTGWRKFHP